MREKRIPYVIKDDDETDKQAESELKNKENQKNKLISGYIIYYIWSE